ncbi:MAG: hypothetical protein P4L53_13590 [Candidatus Obscuribacterales bacterium]|nr:hypothetical protein [Candidatus Obscuribacterales bacterium]
MVKVSRKVGIVIALSGLLFFGGLAYGISKIKFESIKSDIKDTFTPLEEFSSVMLNEDLVTEFANYEYQFLLALAYSKNNEYEKAISAYEKAISSAKKSVGEKSFFTFGAYDQRAMLEYENKHDIESREDFRAALKALPNKEEYLFSRWNTEEWLIQTHAIAIDSKSVSLFREHLVSTEKLISQSVIKHEQLPYSLWYLGTALDDGGRYKEADPFWDKTINEARLEKFPNKKFEPWLMDLAKHEINTGYYSKAEKTLSEVLQIAAQEHNDHFAANAWEAKGDLQLRQNDLAKAEDALQVNLALRKKLKDSAALRYAYTCLEEVARRRNDLTKREEYEKNIAEITEDPKEKARCFLRLAFIAAQNNGNRRVRKYIEQRQSLISRDKPVCPFIYEQDMKNLLVLYPRLKQLGKGKSPSDGFNELKLEHFDLHRDGYHLNSKQASQLVSVISS